MLYIRQNFQFNICEPFSTRLDSVLSMLSSERLIISLISSIDIIFISFFFTFFTYLFYYFYSCFSMNFLLLFRLFNGTYYHSKVLSNSCSSCIFNNWSYSCQYCSSSYISGKLPDLSLSAYSILWFVLIKTKVLNSRYLSYWQDRRNYIGTSG